MSRVDFLGHEVLENGLGAKPNNLEALATLDFPRTQKGLQSVSKLLPPLYPRIRDLCDRAILPLSPRFRKRVTENHAELAFATLRSKIAATPMLKHFNADRQPVVIVYASVWAVSAVLTQEDDGVYMPIKFTSRTLKPNELNYNITEKEILALLHVWNECHNMLVGKTIRVLTRHITLGWLFRSTGLQGRLSQWAAILSPWRLEILRSAKGEEEILGALAASITPRAYVDSALEDIAPRTRPSKTAAIPVPKIGPTESLHVISFDGSASVKREGGAFSASGNYRNVVKAASGYAEGLTVNEAEYRGMLLGLSLLEDLNVTRLIKCRDSNLVVRQTRGEMDCKSLGLELLRQQAWNALCEWPRHEFLHVRRDWNASADMLTLQRQGGKDGHSVEESEDLKTLNRLGERGTRDGKRLSCDHPFARRVPLNLAETAGSLEGITGATAEAGSIRTAQDEELWIANLKEFLSGDISELFKDEVKSCVKIAEQYEVGKSGLLYYHVQRDESAENRYLIMNQVVPETLRQDVLHHYHASLEGGHQGIGRTYQLVRRHFHWPGLFKSVQRHWLRWIICRHCPRHKTHGVVNLGRPVYGFRYREGKCVAYHADRRPYEEAVFRRFGDSEEIRHDREPEFMSDFFRAFNKLMGQRQRATLAYRPQANGSAERMAIKMYIEDIDQRDWDEYAKRLTYALNTAHDRTRDETPFFLVHGWDPRSTLGATLAIGNTSHRDAEARRWRIVYF
ncbi:LOW QUALITY PROTEIN: reverse transcriptase [Phytophthora megakarya]|uniref:Reverse transcriptase n=1 Tax=Phytophthora megakarya TaxID=4795 RepID=A0A225UY64_9STRA|nr:LOW QUALITY PROTEIN: reverse transcriptase [Phytophthora megakarya]